MMSVVASRSARCVVIGSATGDRQPGRKNVGPAPPCTATSDISHSHLTSDASAVPIGRVGERTMTVSLFRAARISRLVLIH